MALDCTNGHEEMLLSKKIKIHIIITVKITTITNTIMTAMIKY